MEEKGEEIGNGYDFLTLDNIENFTFNLFTVVAATEFTKRMIVKICKIKKKKNRVETEFLVFTYSLILSIIRTLSNSDTSWNDISNCLTNIFLIIINALIISYLSTAGYSKLLENKAIEDMEKYSNLEK